MDINFINWITAEEAPEITYKSEKNRQETQFYEISYV